MTLRELARGAPCYLRLPGVCNGDPSTVVLAHIRDGHTAGIGQKPPDTCALPACSACHDVLDRRVKSGFSRDFLMAEPHGASGSGLPTSIATDGGWSKGGRHETRSRPSNG